MTSVQKKAYIAGGMVLSTLVFPWPLIYYFMIFPALYTGVIVPFFLWHNVLGGQFKRIAKDTLLWKIPAIIVLYLILNIGELSTFYILPFLPESLPLYILAEMVMIFILRVITYGAMLFVWQPDLFKNFPKIKISLMCMMIISAISAGYSVVSDINRYKNLLDFL